MTASTGVGRGAPGRPKTPEHVAKVAAALTGKRLTEEHRANVAEGTRRAVADGTEARRKIRLGQDQRIAANGQKRDGRGFYRAEIYETMLAAQGGVCAICGRTPTGRRFHIDHDHSCGGEKHACQRCVRGILCASCNRVLGLMMDDPARLRKAAAYLEAHAWFNDRMDGVA